jgi:hypothetical protein
LKRDTGRNDVRIDGSDQAEVSGEEEDDTEDKRQKFPAFLQTYDEFIKSQEPDQRKNPDKIDPGWTEPI